MTSGAGRPLSILHVCPRPSFSGLEAYVFSLAEGQKKLGHRIEVAVLADSPLAKKCEAAQIATLAVQPGLKGQAAFARVATAKLRAAGRPDIVHMHGTQDLNMMIVPLAAARARGRNRARAILQTHIWISHSKRDPLHAISYALVDEVWCSSGPARESLERFLPIPASKLRVVPYGREVDAMERGFQTRDAARATLHVPADATVVGTVARIDRGKGTHELLEAALRTMQTRADLHLVLIGSATADDPHAVAFGKAIEERIASLPAPLKSRVHAPGGVPDSYRLLKAFDLFVLATYKECFALSLLEALLAGIPCLATDSGGSPEVVRPGQTGWLFEPRSIESLHETLTKALSERSSWDKLGAAGRSRVEKDFDFARILPTTIDAYRELIAKR